MTEYFEFEGQASAWRAVWDLCEKLGMDTFRGGATGEQRVLDFIRQLADKSSPSPTLSNFSVVRAPWTADQVISLNEYQRSGSFHPFTCSCSPNHNLVATVNGWICPHNPEYRQDWAHAFAINGEWRGFKTFGKLQ